MSTPEPEIAAREAKRSGSSLVLWLPLVILVLYALSPGPAFKLAAHLRIGGPALNVFYIPLGFLNERVPAVHAFYDWYLPLWGDK